ncbi:acyl-CoA dehydrogenase family protein [Streptomyces sp. NRRL S-920]|uniref:acyl-CoA dehydrogenase family protein n=1 Tax=Streptomyces sp. NRRL S-920 TaxID=1463921 RepID=UPI0004C9073E|nr:acyl-CoA dehydrogenase family protein [Streptomyces sp. NRRL S-920]
MRLESDDVQRDLASAVRAGLAPAAGPDGALDPAEVHACLTDLDLYALELPDSAAGLAYGLSHAVPVCEELGRWAAPDSYRAATLLADLIQSADPTGDGHPTPGDAELLTGIAAGKVTVGLASGDRVTATGGPGGLRISGDCTLPQPPPDASFHVVPARHAQGTVFAAVAVDSPGVTCAATRREGILRLSLKDVAPLALSAPAHDTGGVPSPLLVRARVRQAAHLLGLAAGAHRLAVGRAARRRQFGRSIGENQAVAFPLAEQFAHLEAGRLLIGEAAWDADGGRPAAVGATQSLAYAAELALRVTAYAVHVHGAAGITGEYAVQRYYRAAAVEATRWGAPTALWQEAGRLRLP